MSDSRRHIDPSFWAGLFLGGLVGAAMIFFLGTEKGKKLAKKLTDEGLEFLDDAKDTVKEKTEETRKQVMMHVEELEEKSVELIQKGKELVEEGKILEEQVVEKAVETKDELAEKAIEKADEALAHIEQLQERGRASTAELRKRLFKNIPKRTS